MGTDEGVREFANNRNEKLCTTGTKTWELGLGLQGFWDKTLAVAREAATITRTSTGLKYYY
jgi:hypothetical protein